MSWLAAQLLRRYRHRRARQHAAQSAAAPSAFHPVLGLGGRSIELSIASKVLPDLGAFELAADDLHTHVVQQDRDRNDLLLAARWLRDVWPPEAPVSALARLDSDLKELGGRQANRHR